MRDRRRGHKESIKGRRAALRPARTGQLRLPQTEIAEALGYDPPNIISMFKTGRTMVPIEIIPKLAGLLGVSELYFMELALEAYHPTLWMVIERAFGKLVSENEIDIVDVIEPPVQAPHLLIRKEPRKRVRFPSVPPNPLAHTPVIRPCG